MGQDFSRFFRPGRVHRRIYTDPGIFELEMVNIFGKAWIYIGHESQVKNPGDYFATHLGRRPLPDRPGWSPAWPPAVRPALRRRTRRDL